MLLIVEIALRGANLILEFQHLGMLRAVSDPQLGELCLLRVELGAQALNGQRIGGAAGVLVRGGLDLGSRVGWRGSPAPSTLVSASRCHLPRYAVEDA